MATGTPTVAVVGTSASTGAGGAEETLAPIPTTVETAPIETSSETSATMTEAPTATVTRAPGESAATTVAMTLAPAPVPTGSGTIAELASADPELSRFAQVLRQGRVYETLNSAGTYTVAAPEHAAFDAVRPAHSPASSSTATPSRRSRTTT